MINQAQRKQTSDPDLTARLLHNTYEAVFILSLAVALYLVLALLNYHPDDPGWSHSSDTDTVHNNTGVVGAWLADILLYLVGYLAYFLPLILCLSSWRLCQNKKYPLQLDFFKYAIHTAGLTIGFVGGCALAWTHLHTGTSLPHQPMGAGGILGDAVGSTLQMTAGSTGGALIALSMLLIGFTLYTGLSWVYLIDTIGHWGFCGYAWLQKKRLQLKDVAEGRKARHIREELIKQEQAAIKQRTPPKIEPAAATLETGIRVELEKQKTLFDLPNDARLPPLTLLDEPEYKANRCSKETLNAISRQVEIKLKDFGVSVSVAAVLPGPIITRFELQPASGVKVNQIANLSKDLARSLSVTSVRIVEVIPGKPFVGLEIPNEDRELVVLREILGSKEYETIKSPLALGLGKDISGRPVVTDLSKMPHLLVAGTTGSGKSVALSAMILSLLYKSTTKDVRMIMIDPKMLELSVYQGIPHLLVPVVTDMKEAANALRWCVAEMERRYKLMALLGARNISGYNRKVATGQAIPDSFYTATEDDKTLKLEQLPFIVVVIDELADMMMTVGKKVEELIARLAQKARAAGIHLILATQRPSVDVITGLIKANIPGRIAFQVSSKIDSRTILDRAGAENLLGHGDMLFLPTGTSIPERVHGAFVSDDEVHKVVKNISRDSEPDYNNEIVSGVSAKEGGLTSSIADPNSETDPLYDEAVRIVTETRKASISYIQRRLKVGYNRAARMIEEMENSGLVGPLEASGNRTVLAAPPPLIDQ